MSDRRPPGTNLSNALWKRGEQTDPRFPPPAQLEQQNMAELFFDRAHDAQKKAFARYRRAEESIWSVTSWAEVAAHVYLLAKFLHNNLGVKSQDRVAIMSNTRYDWVVADLAILSIGAISTPIFQSNSPHEAGYILWDADVQHVFVENEEQFQKISRVSREAFEVPEGEGNDGTCKTVNLQLKNIISFEPISPEIASAHPFSGAIWIQGDIIHQQQPPSLSQIKSDTEFQKGIQNIDPTHLASLVYTSGTTGVFKGVIQTHRNHLSMLDMTLLSGLLGTGEGLFLFLPLAHSFARLVAYSAIASGGDLIFPSILDSKTSRFDAKTLLNDLRESHPQILPSVPRIFEKIMTGLTSAGTSFRERMAAQGIKLYRDLKPKQEKGQRLGVADQLRLHYADAIVSKTRQALFGKSFRYGISGGAPISLETVEFFRSIGVKIFEGYGLTETTPATNANTEKYWKPGTVGRGFEGVEFQVNEGDGEILVRGGNVAMGYWKKPKATAEAWTTDGWFATGDIGEIDEEGFLKITDRKKELIVNANGKKIAPAFVEGKLKTSPYISQAFVYGDKKPFLVALLTLEIGSVNAWAQSEGKTVSSPLSGDPSLTQLIANEVRILLSELSPYEQVKRFQILDEEFTIEAGLLTATLKLKRRKISEKYQSSIESLYSASSTSFVSGSEQ